MKNMKKVFALVLVAVMVLALSATAFAQTVSPETPDADNATITITNAAIGETYRVAKLFDATVTGTAGGSIAYQGTIPAELDSYFSKDANTGVISATGALDFDNDDVQAAFRNWANNNVTASAECTSSPLVFTGLPYGYYVITSTQGQTLVTVDSTNPNALIHDKNKTPPVLLPKKYANEEDATLANDTDNNVFIGDTVNYTIEFGTANYDGTDKILSYVIDDDFASGVLTNVNVTSITIGGVEYKVDGETPQFDANKTITIPWVDANNNSLYANGAKIVIKYSAVVGDTVAIDGEGNKNTAHITYTKEGEPPTPPPPITVDTDIFTYAFAIKKVDQAGQPLAGAVFQLPFYVKEAKADDGAYIYGGTVAGEGLTNQVTTPADGLIIVKGVKDGTYTISEIDPPPGYNKLAAPVDVTATKTGKTTTTTTTYLDADGNVVATVEESTSTVLVEIANLAATPVVVVNKTGAELPETGGIGTTIFYVLGGLMMAAAVVLLITKKRVGNVK